MTHGETKTLISTPAKVGEPGGVAALERGLRLMMVLNIEGGLNLSEASRRAGLNKTTALRLFRSLERLGYVRRTAADRYELGPTVYMLASTRPGGCNVGEVVAPALQNLARDTGETAALFIRHGNQRLCIAGFFGGPSMSHVVHPGDLLPLGVGAAGRVLSDFAAGRPANFDGGVVQSIGDRDPDLAGIAAPLFDRHGTLIGAVSILGPRSRLASADKLADLTSRLRRTCESLNQSLALATLPTMSLAS